jgi:hypothetical protein
MDGQMNSLEDSVPKAEVWLKKNRSNINWHCRLAEQELENNMDYKKNLDHRIKSIEKSVAETGDKLENTKIQSTFENITKKLKSLTINSKQLKMSVGVMTNFRTWISSYGTCKKITANTGRTCLRFLLLGLVNL